MKEKSATPYHDPLGADSGGCAVAGNWTDSNGNSRSASVGPRDGPQRCSQMETM